MPEVKYLHVEIAAPLKKQLQHLSLDKNQRLRQLLQEAVIDFLGKNNEPVDMSSINTWST